MRVATSRVEGQSGRRISGSLSRGCIPSTSHSDSFPYRERLKIIYSLYSTCFESQAATGILVCRAAGVVVIQPDGRNATQSLGDSPDSLEEPNLSDATPLLVGKQQHFRTIMSHGDPSGTAINGRPPRGNSPG